MAYEYKIGTTQGGMVTLASLGIPAPQNSFTPSSTERVRGDGAIIGQGWAEDEWHWGFLTQSQRTALRTYIPGRGAHIFIRDLKDDGVTWKDFEVEAEWPKQEDRQTGRRVSFTLKFRAMVELP
jgi:hypothetical protein